MDIVYNDTGDVTTPLIAAFARVRMGRADALFAPTLIRMVTYLGSRGLDSLACLGGHPVSCYTRYLRILYDISSRACAVALPAAAVRPSRWRSGDSRPIPPPSGLSPVRCGFPYYLRTFWLWRYSRLAHLGSHLNHRDNSGSTTKLSPHRALLQHNAIRCARLVCNITCCSRTDT